MEDDSQLLRSFAESRAEAAFSELVRRKAGLVYSAALRQVGGDTLLAQDVAQTVFVDLARKARTIAKRPVLTSWLYQSTRYAALNAVRAERRRRRREEEAQRMNEAAQDAARDEDWNRLRPVLDEEMTALGERDREAILLRYFEGSSYPEMAARLGQGESAVRMRVDRALEKLHARLLRRGIGSTAAALALALANQAVAAPPPGLPAALAGAALAKSAAAGGGAGLLVKLIQISAMKKLQLAIAAFATALGSGLAYRETVAGVHSPAFTVYSICFGTGLLFALVSVVAGHLGDLHGEFGHAGEGTHGHAEAGYGTHDMPGFSNISPTTIATFVTAFGGIGMMLLQVPALQRFSGPLAAALALGIAFAVASAFRYVFSRTQGSSEGRVGQLVGTDATVITPIPTGGVGEIAYVQAGSRYSAPARSELDTALGNGATVRIVRIVGNQFFVRPV